MKLPPQMISSIFQWKILLILAFILFLTTAITINPGQTSLEAYRKGLSDKNDSVASVRAFAKVYKVLMHPRCMNCHPSGDVPLQGNDSHLHAMLPQRGVDGKGIYAMKCSNCHQGKSVPLDNAPPGNPKWHLPPADMKMVFEGKSAHELARQLVNPELNGHKSMDDLIEHASDTLLKAGWTMGGDRTPPPLSYEEFKTEWINWIETGAYAPAEN
ncbi:hypothetical protein LVD17_22610 [Fulvivirga ulvae]|uniref:hypothetical protein n=1 Tax=Fulvivirga ulvae TaxID=2904245 RepID=UPI001F2AA5D0|nr:hypothetical protein [Fulvivirga ulvae]UII31088.1 hypothetical protein LVD17_22610 [Fulvivirga ulvae]